MTPLLLPPLDIIRRFVKDPAAAQISTLGQGNINDTYLVRSPKRTLVLQRINSLVFPNPQILIDNLVQLSHHFSSKTSTASKRWQDPVLLPADNGSLAVQDRDGMWWRALSYIDNSISLTQASTLFQAEQTGWALGHFHQRLVGLEHGKIQVPLPGFHCLPQYLHHYQGLISNQGPRHSPTMQRCMEIVSGKQKEALALERALGNGQIQLGIIHGDPKIANVLFERQSGLAISLIDLDTVGPGLLEHDIGDCLRSVCNRCGESGDPSLVSFDLERCAVTLRGYFQGAGTPLPPHNRALIYDGIKAISFELGLRFLCDYLEGGIYFKCRTPEETLHKALVQFSLFLDIIAKKDPILQFLQPHNYHA